MGEQKRLVGGGRPGTRRRSPVCAQQDFWSAASGSGRAPPRGRHLTGISEPGTEARTGRSAQPQGRSPAGPPQGMPEALLRALAGALVPGGQSPATERPSKGPCFGIRKLLAGSRPATPTRWPWCWAPVLPTASATPRGPRGPGSRAPARGLRGQPPPAHAHVLSPAALGVPLARERERSSLSPLPGALPWLKAGAGPSLFLLKRTRVQRRGPRSVFRLTWRHYQLPSGGPCPLHAGKYDSDREMRIIRADTRPMHASPASGPTVGRRFGGVGTGQTPRSWRDGAEPAPAFASTRQLLPERRRVLGPGRGAGDKQTSPCPQRAGSSRPRLLVLCTPFPRISFTLVPRESPLSPQHLP